MKKVDPKVIPSDVSPGFTQALAREIVKNLTTIGQFTVRPFHRAETAGKKPLDLGEHPILVDTSVLIDGRILPIVNSEFLTGTLLIPQFVLAEVQHLADTSDSLRRAKGRRGLDVAGKLRSQKQNPFLRTKIVSEEVANVPEVDHKLIELAKRWKHQQVRLLTIDFNLAQLARAQGVKVLSVVDLASALKIAIVPGEELTVAITHEGKERQQGVGYLADGTMIVVDEAKEKVGNSVAVVITKVHQTAAGQLFFARLK
ncbi:PIN domain-containing protein [Candidatus Gottesmanbacteria bacterium]|nr:PIN domain-containing protein [Candidatus Gottesmanbacteria bacterium]